MMTTHLPRPTRIVVVLMIAGLLGGLVQVAVPVGAAPPHLELRVGSNATTVTVLDRTQFIVDAFGFQPGEQIEIQASFGTYNGNTITANRTVPANTSGNVFSVNITAPAGAKAGLANVTATGLTSRRQARGRVSVVYHPTFSLNATTIQAGKSVLINGTGFVANAPVRVAVDIFTGSGTQTLSQTVETNYWGNFSTSLRIPDYTRPTTYTFFATDTVGGFRLTARLTVTQQPAPRPTNTPQPRATATPTRTPTPTATPRPTYHASASVFPGTTLPNQNITIIGMGFPGNTRIIVTLTVNLRDASTRTITKFPITDANGNVTTVMRVPAKTSPGAYGVGLNGGVAQTSTQLRVLPQSAHPRNLGFKRISLWYHTVRHGTFDVLVVQAKPHTQLGIWTHIIFPNGKHLDYYKNTDSNGAWQVQFPVPRGAVSKSANQAYITFQLWHGNQTMQAFLTFTVV
jgi:hypothetical protein